jgi:hypothetical protein
MNKNEKLKLVNETFNRVFNKEKEEIDKMSKKELLKYIDKQERILLEAKITMIAIQAYQCKW